MIFLQFATSASSRAERRGRRLSRRLPKLNAFQPQNGRDRLCFDPQQRAKCTEREDTMSKSPVLRLACNSTTTSTTTAYVAWRLLLTSTTTATTIITTTITITLAQGSLFMLLLLLIFSATEATPTCAVFLWLRELRSSKPQHYHVLLGSNLYEAIERKCCCRVLLSVVAALRASKRAK